MDLWKVWCFVFSAIYLLQLAELKVTNYLMKATRRSEKGEGVVFLGYGYNPFGPSTMFIRDDYLPSVNMSFPDAVESNSVDVSDTGQEPGRGKQQGRAKRGVIHLYNMVKCATGCDPLKYKGYGCYCGFLGSGRPVDAIDRCCKRHDWCYNNIGCPPFVEYIQPYYWKCWNGRPICAVEHGEYGGRNSCARRLCECDRVLSECLSHYTCPRTRALCHSSPWRLLQNAFMLL